MSLKLILVVAVLLALTNVVFYLPHRYEYKLAQWQARHPLLAGFVRALLPVAIFICAVLAMKPVWF